LTNFAFAAAVDDPEFVGMGMYVDKARCDREPFAGNAFVRIAAGEVSDRDDPAVGDGDVGRERRAARSVKNLRALEDRPEQRLT
jgi:hypothetical protein